MGEKRRSFFCAEGYRNRPGAAERFRPVRWKRREGASSLSGTKTNRKPIDNRSTTGSGGY